MAIALVALSAATPVAAGMCVDVDLHFKGVDPPPALVGSMEHEASAVWETYGVGIEWSAPSRLASCESVLGSFDVLVEDRSLRPSSPPRAILGTTQITGRGALDHVPVHIDYRAVEQFIERLPIDEIAHALGRTRVSAADVGRALGRVLAHEIGHVVLAAPRHQPRGLMRAGFVAADLIGRDRSLYTLSTAEVNRLRQRECELRAGPNETSSRQRGDVAEACDHEDAGPRACRPGNRPEPGHGSPPVSEPRERWMPAA
jgi:hypothetical protein